ncbi:MDR family oxidoreductase [Kaistia nematophila]|uniref:Oxidoreductase n=1 Tax=Kaistia nematophila TaxID=2994654 RepID=A0A9X3IL16_9HYPH|nr:MDR family oxidoreductase [Kaistia nematophila]MCX5569076.1 oxidoreductase [Kaistia nematophila]
MTFNGLWATKTDDAISVALARLEDDQLMDGDVTVAVDYSTVNYKDGLAVTGKGAIIRKFPLIPGIDFAGTVESSRNPGFKPGDRVVLNGFELSMTHHGGYAQRARVPAEWLVKLPDSISAKDAMAIGTAGYTAMLSVLALEHGGITPDRGPVLVTGASGGVGSISVALLSKLGYRVIASTGRVQEADYLKRLGAAEIIDRASLSEPGAPIAKPKWAGAIDSCGGHTLANVLAQTDYRGTVTACGLADSMELPGSMAPFILRNVTLAGIDSVNAPQSVRSVAWTRLATDLDLGKLETTVQEIGLAEVPQVAAAILEGKVRGRTLVDVNR